MSVMSTLWKREASKDQDAKERLAEIINKLAEDESRDDIDPDDVQRALAEVGWANRDLSREIGRRQKLNKHDALEQEYANAKARKPEILEAIKEADERLEAAKRAHADEVRPLRQSLSEIQDKHNAAFQSRLTLKDLRSEEDNRRIRSAQWEVSRLLQVKSQAERQVRDAEALAESCVYEPDNTWHKDGETVVDIPAKKAALKRVERAQQQVDEIQSQITAASDRVSQLIAKAQS